MAVSGITGFRRAPEETLAPNCVRFTTTQTGYIAPEGEQRYNMVVPGVITLKQRSVLMLPELLRP